MRITFRLKGGEGSGFHGHAGRPGKQGGSQSSVISDILKKTFPKKLDVPKQQELPKFLNDVVDKAIALGLKKENIPVIILVDKAFAYVGRYDFHTYKDPVILIATSVIFDINSVNYPKTLSEDTMAQVLAHELGHVYSGIAWSADGDTYAAAENAADDFKYRIFPSLVNHE
jgi:hypothetical protein